MRRFLVSTALALIAPMAAAEGSCGGDFTAFVQGLKAEAVAGGHAPATVDAFFAGVRQDAKVLKADDAAYALFELDDGVVVQSNSSWTTRVRRDDLVTFHADGTDGSAVCGLFDCYIQPRQATPKPVWNPDERQPLNFFEHWQKVPDNFPPPNGFRVQWEMFLKHVLEDAPYRFTLWEGAKGVQLAELGLKSWQERRWLDVPALGA